MQAAVLDLPLLAIGSTRGDPTNVDLAGATAKGIPVLRAPGRNADGVAEMTVGLLFAVTRHLIAADRDVREGQVYRDGSIPYQRFRAWQLAGRTAGLVGLGAVGRPPVAARGPRHERHRQRPVRRRRVPSSSTTCWPRPTWCRCTPPVTPETLGLMSAERFAQMQDGAVYVNSARAGLHDLDALIAALASGHLAAAALDHFEGEIIATDHPLVAMPNVVLTPHIGGATYDTETNHTTLMADGLGRAPAGRAPRPTSPTRRSSAMADQITSPTTTPEAVLAAAKKMLADGLVEGTSGNISGRLPEGGLVCLSPSSVPYDTMTLDDLVVVDLDGNVVEGERSPTTEKDLHLVRAASLSRARLGDPHPRRCTPRCSRSPTSRSRP